MGPSFTGDLLDYLDRNEQPFYFRVSARTFPLSPEMEFIFPPPPPPRSSTLRTMPARFMDMISRGGGGRERIERGTKGLSSRQSTRDPGERIARRYSRGSRFASPETRYLLLFGLHVFDSGHCGPRGIDISPPSPA